MPAIRRNNIAAGTANALLGLKFTKIGLKGAFITLYASTPVAGAQVTFSAMGGDKEIVNLAEVNVEIVADGVDSGRDLLLADEPVGPGDLFLQVDTQICNFLLLIEEG